MQSDPDLEMARKLQQQFDTEYGIENPNVSLTYNGIKSKKSTKVLNTSRPKGLADPSWELVDPTPNIHILFVHFNERFFWNKLLPVAVSWSKRMTVCAGICSYQGKGGLCQITLSEPLLKLRPRKDLVETLLHEMIHAFLFISNNDRDRDGHGPNFHKHMYRINNEAGTNISVYHDFHDEVRLYQQHWWRCDGVCQKKPPFFGMVRRSINRAPGPNDTWWADHQQKCNGKFIKVKTPDKPEKPVKNKKDSDKKPPNQPDIRSFIPVVKPKLQNKENNHTTNINTINITAGNPAIPRNPQSINIKGFTNSEQIQIKVFSGTGIKLNISTNIQTNHSNPVDAVRNHWAKKYETVKVKKEPENTPKKSSTYKTKNVNKELENALKKSETVKRKSPKHDEKTAKIPRLFSDLNTENNEITADKFPCPVCHVLIEETKLNQHLDLCLLNKPSTSKTSATKKCEICEIPVNLSEFDAHVQVCLTKCYDNNDVSKDSLNVSCLVCNKDVPKDELNLHLDDCMASVFDKNNIVVIEDDDDDVGNDNNHDGGDDNNDKKYNCPICMITVDEINMNKHIDECLNTAALKNGIFD